MDSKKIILIAVAALVLSIAANVALAFLFQKVSGELAKEREVRQNNAKLLLFRNLFTENIILSEKSVDFENRLKMEEAARDLNDPKIFALWQDFTESQNSDEVNARAKNLLDALIDKTQY